MSTATPHAVVTQKDWVSHTQQSVNENLKRLIPTERTAVDTAMRYALLNGGKRLRPLLVYAVGYDLGGIEKQLNHSALAIELIHTYTLIHDDLPAMDNDDLRRGHPTCHIAFDEATAILAGDALQTLAFHQLAHLSPTLHLSEHTLQMIQTLSEYSSHHQVIAGQALDMAAENKTNTSIVELDEIHTLKTASLIKCSLLLGALSTGQNAPALLNALTQIGSDLGLAFQIQDDMLDVTSDEKQLGKKTGQDTQQHKSTYPQLMSIKACSKKTTQLFHNISDTLDTLPYKMLRLRELVEQIKNRRH